MNHNADHSAAPIAPGDQVGKYRIELQIGSGGGAIVWRGIDPLLNKVVAIKQLFVICLFCCCRRSLQAFCRTCKGSGLDFRMSEARQGHVIL